jgi:hypothetical protein
MSFTPTDFHDLVRVVEEHPEWRTELRRLVLTDSLLALPEQVTELRLETDRRFQELAAAQQRTEEQVAQLVYVTQTLVTDVGTLKGDMLELRYRNRAASYLGRIARRMRTLSADELAELLDDAVDQGQLSIAEKDEIMLADPVVRGRRRDDDTAVYLLVEVSWSIGPYDVERAVKRAALLSRLGTPVLPVVAGRIMTETVEQLARERKVWRVTDGRTVGPAEM